MCVFSLHPHPLHKPLMEQHAIPFLLYVNGTHTRSLVIVRVHGCRFGQGGKERVCHLLPFKDILLLVYHPNNPGRKTSLGCGGKREVVADVCEIR